MYVYLALPLTGFSLNERFSTLEKVERHLQEYGFRPINPIWGFNDKKHLDINVEDLSGTKADPAVIHRRISNCLEMSCAVLVIGENSNHISHGVAYEIGFATAKNMSVFGWFPVSNKVQSHPFISRSFLYVDKSLKNVLVAMKESVMVHCRDFDLDLK